MMNNNIHMAIMGPVNSGKSTFLNSIFCNSFSEMGDKKKTKNFYKFIENMEKETHLDMSKDIAEKVEKHNQETNKPQLVTIEVGKIQLELLENQSLTVYDIPGLNDSTMKKGIQEYLKSSFTQYDIIVFLLDFQTEWNLTLIQSMLIHYIEEEKKKNHHVYVYFLINKCDNLHITENGDFIAENGWNEKCQSIRTLFSHKNMENYIIDIFPLCALDAFLYRMLSVYGKDYVSHLEKSDIDKIGLNEMGKKFNRLSEKEQRETVEKIIENKDFLSEMIRLSGFGFFEKSLSRFLKESEFGKKIRLHKIYSQYHQLPSVEDCMLNNTKENDIKNIAVLIEQHIATLSPLETMYRKEYDDMIHDIFQEIHGGAMLCIVKMTHPYEIKQYYDSIINQLFKKYFPNENTTLYPDYMKEAIFKMIQNIFLETILNVDCIESMFKLIEEIGDWRKDVISILIVNMMKNFHGRKAVSFEYHSKNPSDILERFHLQNKILIERIRRIRDELDVHVSSLLRFLLMNQMQSSWLSLFSHDVMSKMFMYEKYGEIAFSIYLKTLFLSKDINIECWPLFMIGYNNHDNMMSSPLHMLDMFYIENEVKFNHVMNIRHATPTFP